MYKPDLELEVIMCKKWAFLLVILMAASVLAGEVSFTKIVVDKTFRAEGVATGDVNRDGKLDILSGDVWYAAPDWKMHSILAEPKAFSPKNYSDAFCCFAEDVNRDGRPDLIVVDIPGKPTCWFENPGTADGPWKRHVAVPVTNNESPIWVDVTGDGRPELVCGYSPDPAKPDSPQRRMAYSRPGEDPYAVWPLRTFSAESAPGTYDSIAIVLPVTGISNVRVSAKETGVASNAGTCEIKYALGW